MSLFYKFALAVVIIISSFQIACDKDEDCTNNSPVNCSLEPSPGPCLAAFRRYYFDQEEKICKEFIWGGCGGIVPFETLEECQVCACN